MYSEFGSRVNSMSNTVKTSKDNIEMYRALCNSYRQASITNSIIEIVSSVNM